jgi:hypothetical protein
MVFPLKFSNALRTTDQNQQKPQNALPHQQHNKSSRAMSGIFDNVCGDLIVALVCSMCFLVVADSDLIF